MNPESFSDAVDQASRLESLKKPRSAGAKSLVAMETEVNPTNIY